MSHIATNEFLNPLQVKGKEKSQFPKGLKVLAIDDNVVCLKVLESILQKCGYTVTTTRDANVALEMLKKNKERFDIVITDVVRDDIDGFKLLEAIGLEMDIPVIMTSANDDTKTIVEGIKHGAIDYLVKPIKMEDVNIFQHVTTTIKDDDHDHEHKVVPKRILEIMNEPGITREKVASHLQKFRNGLKKQNAMNFAPISCSYPGIDNLVYRPVLATDAISQPGVQYHHHHHQKMDDEIANNVHHHHSAIFGYQNHVLGDSVYICPYSSVPVSMNNYVCAPYQQVCGDVSVSPFDSTGLVVTTSTQGANGCPINFCGVQLDPLTGNDQSRFLQQINHGSEGRNNNNLHENDCGSLDDDDFNIMLQQFQDNSTPRL
ncbi:hypothetical protein HAX54_033967 [Datura stramonium]|uniref:Response regulatory domain-containing protein n=1 Tax=Datura stramonium TaxID=4076 RepID=A0ABS8SE14_DATST|nr:hypothetical protein [Datura stramonium]